MTIELTVKAAERVKTLIEKRVQEWLDKNTIEATEKDHYLKNLGFRVGLQGGGCSGFTYYSKVDEATDNDVVFSWHGVNVYVDSQSYAYLYGTKVDWVETDMEQKFVFDIPKSTGGCGCGKSVGFE